MDGAALLDREPPAQHWVPSALDALACPDEVAEWAAEASPGPDAGHALAALDPAHLSHYGRVDLLAAIEKQLAFWQAKSHRALAALAADPPLRGDDARRRYVAKRYVREQVSCALRLSDTGAADRLALAEDLVGRLPQTLDAVQDGALSDRHARVLADATRTLDESQAREVQRRVLAGAGDQSVATFRRRVGRAVLSVAPATAAERHDKARQDRKVESWVKPDGMAAVFALLPAEGAQAVMAAVNARAGHCEPGDPRTAPQRRADALRDLALDWLRGPCAAATDQCSEPTDAGLHPAISVCVALSTLRGLDDQAAELEGYGPVPARLVRDLAEDPTASWRAIVTDDTGRFLDYGRTTYRPPARLRRHVIARDRTCRFPHCNRRARHADLDHRTAWEDGGTTSAHNLHSLSPRHHKGKHEAGWTPRLLVDGGTEWTSPDGHVYVKPAETYPLDRDTGPPRTADPDPPPF